MNIAVKSPYPQSRTMSRLVGGGKRKTETLDSCVRSDLIRLDPNAGKALALENIFSYYRYTFSSEIAEKLWQNQDELPWLPKQYHSRILSVGIRFTRLLAVLTGRPNKQNNDALQTVAICAARSPVEAQENDSRRPIDWVKAECAWLAYSLNRNSVKR